MMVSCKLACFALFDFAESGMLGNLGVVCLDSFKYVKVTSLMFTYEHIYLHSYMHHMPKFWYENGLNGVIFTSKVSHLSWCDTITYLTPQRGTRTISSHGRS